MKWQLLILILILALQLNASPNHPQPPAIGYETLNNGLVWHIWNEKNDYYFNATSGIQFTNHYQEYWSKNIFCGGIESPQFTYYCEDIINFDFKNTTDNINYVNITGTRQINIPSVGLQNFTLNYFLPSQSDYLIIELKMKNLGSKTLNKVYGFKWLIRDIDIEKDGNTDFTTLNYTEYDLNTSLNKDFRNMTLIDLITWNETENQTIINYLPYLKIHNDNSKIDLIWNETENYSIKIKSEAGQNNAQISYEVNWSSLGVGQERIITLKWNDQPDSPAIYGGYNATIVYSSKSLSGTRYPKYRVWSNETATWSQEFEMSAPLSTNMTSVRVFAQHNTSLASNLSWVYAVILSLDKNLSLYASNNSGWTWQQIAYNFGNTSEGQLTNAQTTPYDIAEESNSTKIMIAYDTTVSNSTKDIAYRILDGAVLGSEQYIDLTAAGEANLLIRTLRMASSPNISSNEIVLTTTRLVASTSLTHAKVWNGVSWNNEKLIAGGTAFSGDMSDVAYETQSFNALVVANNGTNLIRYCKWTTATSLWSMCSAEDPNSNANNNLINVNLYPDPSSNNITIIQLDDINDATATIWNSTNTTDWISLDANLDFLTNVVSFAYNHSEGFGQFVYDTDGTGTTISNRSLTKGGIISGATTSSIYRGGGFTIDIKLNPSNKTNLVFMGIRQNASGSGGSGAISTFSYNDQGVWTGENGNALLSTNCTGGAGIKCFDWDWVNPLATPPTEGNPPVSVAFTVWTLGGGGNSTNSNPTSPGNSTEGYYFNATGLYHPLVKPCANADAVTNCQNGMNKPMYRISNTGSLALTGFWMKLSTSNSGTGIKVCANSTGTASVLGTVAACDLTSTEGSLNSSGWLQLASAVPLLGDLNITVYANFSYVLGGSYNNINYLNGSNI